jgi:hypothetical protein
MNKYQHKNNLNNSYTLSKRNYNKKPSTNSHHSDNESDNTLPTTPTTSSSRKESKRCHKQGKYKSKRGVKRVSFKKNYLQVINVESYKKYNFENTCDEPLNDGISNVKGSNRNNKVHCKCNIF